MKLSDFYSGLPWYIDPETGQPRQVEMSDEGGYIPPQTADGEPIPLLEDGDERITAYVTQQLGYDPNQVRYAGGGEKREIFNPQSGQWELSVVGADGQRMPESVARSQGLSYSPEEGFKSESGGFFPQIFSSVKEMATDTAPLWMTALSAGLSGPLVSALGGGLQGQAALGAITSGITGGNPLLGAATSLIPSGLGAAGVPTDFIPAASGALGAAAKGNDPIMGGLMGAAGSLIGPSIETASSAAPEAVGAYTEDYTGGEMSGFYNDLVGIDNEDAWLGEAMREGGSSVPWYELQSSFNAPGQGISEQGEALRNLSASGVDNDDAYLGDYFRSIGAGASVPGLDPNGVDNDDAYTGEYLRSLGGDPPVGTGPNKSIYGAAGGLAALAKFAQSLLDSGDPNKLTLGQRILKQLTGDPLSTAFSAAPFLLSLNEANKQGKDIDGSIDQFKSMIPRYQAFGNQARGEFDALNKEIGSAGDLTAGRYGDLLGEVTGNQSAFLNAQINPLRQAQATGYGNLLQDQGLRGIRGSSFGDQSITNFMTDTNRSIADQTSKALQSSYGLRSGLVGSADDAAMRSFGLRGANTGASLNAGMNSLQGESGVLRNVLEAQTKRNTNRNMLLGAGLSASGRLFQPQQNSLSKWLEELTAQGRP